MKIKRIMLITIVLIIGFFIIGWIFTKPFIDRLIDYYMSMTSNAQIVATTLNEQFKIHLFSSISIGLLPLFCFLTTVLLIKIKSCEISLKDYFIYLIFIVGGFIAGGLIKIFLLARLVRTLDIQDFPHLINTFPLNLVKFHDYALILSLIVCLFISLLAKKTKSII